MLFLRGCTKRFVRAARYAERPCENGFGIGLVVLLRQACMLPLGGLSETPCHRVICNGLRVNNIDNG